MYQLSSKRCTPVHFEKKELKGNPRRESLSGTPTQFLGPRRNYRSGIRTARWAILIACLAHAGFASQSGAKSGVIQNSGRSEKSPEVDKAMQMIIAMGQNEKKVATDVPASPGTKSTAAKTVNGRATGKKFNWPCNGPAEPVPFKHRGGGPYRVTANAPRYPPPRRSSSVVARSSRAGSKKKRSRSGSKKSAAQKKKAKKPPVSQNKPKAPTPRVLPTGCFCIRVNRKDAYFYPKGFSADGAKIVGTLYSRMPPKEQGGVANGTRTIDVRTRRVKNGQYYIQYTNYATKLATPKNSCSKPKWDKERRRLMDRLIRETIRAEE